MPRDPAVGSFFALTVGGVLVFVADILAGAVAYQEQWVDRWSFLTSIVSAQDGIRAGATLTLFIATATMLCLELRTSRWSLPLVLDIVGIAMMVGVALRPRSLFLFLVIWTSQHWMLATGGFANSFCRTQAGEWHFPAISTHVEYQAVGSFAVPDSVVDNVAARLRGGSKPRHRNIRWRPNFRSVCDGTADIGLGSCAAGAGLCHGIHSLPARSKRLSNVGSQGARGGF